MTDQIDQLPALIRDCFWKNAHGEFKTWEEAARWLHERGVVVLKSKSELRRITLQTANIEPSDAALQAALDTIPIPAGQTYGERVEVRDNLRRTLTAANRAQREVNDE